MSDELTSRAAANPQEAGSAAAFNRDWMAIGLAVIAIAISAISCWVSWATADRGLQAAEIDQRRQERAYLAVEGIQVMRYEAGKPWQVVLTIENHGNTPALKVRTQFGNGIIDRPSPPAVIKRFLQDMPTRAGQATITGKMVKGVIGPAVSWRDAKAIAQGKKELIFYGRVKYHDVFGEARQSEFCITARALIGGELRQGICRSGNDAT